MYYPDSSDSESSTNSALFAAVLRVRVRLAGAFFVGEGGGELGFFFLGSFEGGKGSSRMEEGTKTLATGRSVVRNGRMMKKPNELFGIPSCSSKPIVREVHDEEKLDQRTWGA